MPFPLIYQMKYYSWFTNLPLNIKVNARWYSILRCQLDIVVAFFTLSQKVGELWTMSKSKDIIQVEMMSVFFKPTDFCCPLGCLEHRQRLKHLKWLHRRSTECSSAFTAVSSFTSTHLCKLCLQLCYAVTSCVYFDLCYFIVVS